MINQPIIHMVFTVTVSVERHDYSRSALHLALRITYHKYYGCTKKVVNWIE
jgi:hypothetical protein